MDLIAALLIAAAFPVLCLAFLLWMARFEDGLPHAVRRTARQPDPAPIVAIPIQREEPPVERIFTLDATKTRTELDGSVTARPV